MKSKAEPCALVWLRRDLRLHDHAPLAAALAQDLPVQPVFVFDADILERFANPQDRRLTFIAAALLEMEADLTQRGGGLLVFHGKARQLIPAIATTLSAQFLTYGEDNEPATEARDRDVRRHLPDDCQVEPVLDHRLFAPNDVLKKDGTPYKVFTPYAKACRPLLDEARLKTYRIADKGRYATVEANRKALQKAGLNPLDLSNGLEGLLKQIGYKLTDLDGWEVGAGRSRLASFVKHHMKGYGHGRDFMGADETSRLSPYLRFGRISIRECARAALEHDSEGARIWLTELLWREFYAQILAHFPKVVSHEFSAKYHGVKWSHAKEKFKAWQEGRTGYPLVDAAQRQLLEIGWMHNRARMVTASFLTKDLHIDWRWGEEHFAQHLMDYELASNNGGWQWAASTGTDPQPYFRIFNPVSQSERFDPEGEYIKRYVPELQHLKGRDLHEPWRAKNPPKDYPKPIVDHKEAAKASIAMFRGHTPT